MSVHTVCDKCQKEINEDFVQIESYFYAIDERGMPSYCTFGDQIVMCDKCYDEFMSQITIRLE